MLRSLSEQIEIRTDPADIDETWLTAALESSGVARGATVVGVDYAGDMLTNGVARLGRFALRWDESDGRPATMVGKFPSSDPETAAVGFDYGLYLNECRFYDRLAGATTMQRPDCFFVSFDAEPAEFVLLLEDIEDATPGDEANGLSIDQVSAALEQIVALHAPRFGDPTLETDLVDGEEPLSPHFRAQLYQPFYTDALESFEALLGDRLEADIMKVCRNFAAHVDTYVIGSGTPSTLTHANLRADNLMFANTDTSSVTVLDFQMLSAGLGMADVASLISRSFADPTDRASSERDLVEAYRAQMSAAGIDMSADQCWNDYRFASLAGLFISVTSAASARPTEQDLDLFAAMTHRHGRQAIELDALGLFR